MKPKQRQYGGGTAARRFTEPFKPPAVGETFNPFQMFNGLIIPEPLAKYRALSLGAKMAWGRLARYAGENGHCYPAAPTLASEIGISTTQARAYLRELRIKKFIAIEQRPGTSAVYTFLWHEAFMGEIGEKRKTPPLLKTDRVPLRKTDRVTLSENRKATLSENRQRRESVEESHHQESQFEESQSPEPNPTQPKRLVSIESEPKTSSMKEVVDDDEKAKPKPKPFPERPKELARATDRLPTQMEPSQPHEQPTRADDPVFASPVDELIATVKQRTGQSLSFKVVDRINASLESKGVTMAEYLAAVKLHNLEALRSAPAFLTDFASGFLSAKKSVVPETVKPEDKPRTCELGICQGRGHEKLATGVEIRFCECSIGRELRAKFNRAEERSMTSRDTRPSQPEAL